MREPDLRIRPLPIVLTILYFAAIFAVYRAGYVNGFRAGVRAARHRDTTTFGQPVK